MAWRMYLNVSLFLWLVLSLHISYSITVVNAKSRRPISVSLTFGPGMESGHIWAQFGWGKTIFSENNDVEIKTRKDECYADIESGLWGWNCKSSMVAKENCALKCLSPHCYELIYESDPLEEGEKDLVRSQEYKYCMHRLSMGESLEGVRGSFS